MDFKTWLENEIKNKRYFEFNGDGMELKVLIKEIRKGYINEIDEIFIKYKNQLKTIYADHEIEIINKFISYLKKEVINGNN